MTAAAIALTDVTKRFGSHVALDSVSLEVLPGTAAVVLGPSGCGKTTMLRIIATMMGLGLMLSEAQAVEIKLLASNALRTVLQEVAPQFEQASGHKLSITFGSTGNLTASIDKGTPFDATIMSGDALDNLIKRGAVATTTPAAQVADRFI